MASKKDLNPLKYGNFGGLSSKITVTVPKLHHNALHKCQFWMPDAPGKNSHVEVFSLAHLASEKEKTPDSWNILTNTHKSRPTLARWKQRFFEQIKFLHFRIKKTTVPFCLVHLTYFSLKPFT